MWVNSNGSVGLSSYQGNVAVGGQERSYVGPSVAYTRYYDTSGEKNSIFAWSEAAPVLEAYTIRRGEYPYYFSSLRNPSCGAGCELVGRPVVVSGDLFPEHLLFYARDP